MSSRVSGTERIVWGIAVLGCVVLLPGCHSGGSGTNPDSLKTGTGPSGKLMQPQPPPLPGSPHGGQRGTMQTPPGMGAPGAGK